MSDAPLLSRVLLIINPAAGSGFKRRKLDRVIQDLKESAGHLELFYTAQAFDATRLIRGKRKEPWTLLLCAGGDGTINEVIQGWMEGWMEETSLPTGACPPPFRLPLGILPTGTWNGLAREIGLPLDPWKAYRRILTGTPTPVFIGQITMRSASPSPDHRSFTRYFTLLAGAGFDGYVAQRVEQRRGLLKKLPKLGVYFFYGITGLFTYRYPTFHFVVDGKLSLGTTGVITKGKMIAGPLTFSPGSDLRSPSMTLCLVKGKGMIDYLKLFLSFLICKRPGIGIEYLEGKRIEILEGPGEVQADGESLGPLPALFTSVEKPLYLIYPGLPDKQAND
ncbi:MAG: diacylglycerol kinase family protein [Candidatus Manganitrophaceae bacterium]